MKNLYALTLCLLALAFFSCNNTSQNSDTDLLKQLSANRIRLSNGWSLTMVGKSIPLGDLPLNLVKSPSEKYLAVTNNGQSTHSLQLIDVKTEKIISEIEIPKAWYGLKFSADERQLFASGGNDNRIRIYQIDNQKLSLQDSIVLGKPWDEEKISPTGIEIDSQKNILYTVTKEDSALYVCDIAQRKVKDKIKLPAEAFACVLNQDASQLYISIWGGEQVVVFDTQSKKITHQIKVASHPNEMILTKNGKYLLVANSNDNSVSVIDTQSKKVIETLNASLYPESLAGSTTNGLAFSANEKQLFIANADNNCLAVFDFSNPGKSKSMGFIPTGWYPTSVKVIQNKIYVANGKGNQSMPNPKGPNPYKRRDKDTQYIGRLFTGSLSIIEMPNTNYLAAYSKLVYDNTPYNKEKEKLAEGEAGNPIPRKAGEKSPIKYVFYIIKENRTYDQILGDVKEGNGDTSICIFPKKVTPNHHAWAKEFVLLDNFYVDAEVSADGHNWSMAAYATDFTEKTWPTSYGGRGGNYDYEGTRPIASPTKGYLWDYCQRAGVSYRSYGEFVWDGQTNYPALKGKYAPRVPSYDLKIKDMTRFEYWKEDFDSLLAINQVPQLSVIRFGNDHTAGTSKGMPSPRAMVAENDLAVGTFVEYLSKSKIWKESVVFILEDDAQNGSDHVDAHRSVAFVISPYIKRKSIDHTLYSTSAMLRTIELILGIPPMSQYDAAATPMWRCFSSKPDFTPYFAKPATWDINEMNPNDDALNKLSANFDFSKEDAAPDIPLNRAIWKSIKGINSEMPAPKRAAFLLLKEEGDEEGD